jgi:hypothetical protein
VAGSSKEIPWGLLIGAVVCIRGLMGRWRKPLAALENVAVLKDHAEQSTPGGSGPATWLSEGLKAVEKARQPARRWSRGEQTPGRRLDDTCGNTHKLPDKENYPMMKKAMRAGAGDRPKTAANGAGRSARSLRSLPAPFVQRRQAVARHGDTAADEAKQITPTTRTQHGKQTKTKTQEKKLQETPVKCADPGCANRWALLTNDVLNQLYDEEYLMFKIAVWQTWYPYSSIAASAMTSNGEASSSTGGTSCASE